MLPLLFVPHEPQEEREEEVIRGNSDWCTGDIVIWARIPASNDDYNSEDKNVGRGILEKLAIAREIAIAEAKRRFRIKPVAVFVPSEREREKDEKKKKDLNVALVLEQNMAHVTSHGTIGPAGREQRARTSFDSSIFLLDACSRRSITENTTFESPEPDTLPRNKNTF